MKNICLVGKQIKEFSVLENAHIHATTWTLHEVPSRITCVSKNWKLKRKKKKDANCFDWKKEANIGKISSWLDLNCNVQTVTKYAKSPIWKFIQETPIWNIFLFIHLQVYKSLSIKFRLWNIFAKIAKLSKAAFFQRPQQSFSISPGPTEIKIKSVTIFFLLKMKLKRKWNLRIVLPSKVFLLTKEQTTRMTLNENCYEFFASRSQILWAVIFSFFPSLLQNNRCKSRENRNFFSSIPSPKCQRNHVFFT